MLSEFFTTPAGNAFEKNPHSALFLEEAYKAADAGQIAVPRDTVLDMAEQLGISETQAAALSYLATLKIEAASDDLTRELLDIELDSEIGGIDD